MVCVLDFLADDPSTAAFGFALFTYLLTDSPCSSVAAVWWWYLTGMILRSNFSHHAAEYALELPSGYLTELWNMFHLVR